MTTSTQKPSGRYEVTLAAAASGGSKAQIHIFGFIGDWWEELDAGTLARQIKALDVGEIELHINSPGGDMFDGLAIMNALRQHDATVTTYVDGLAASAASLVALGGDRIVMTTGSQMMVHEASTFAYGNAEAMRAIIARLDKASDGMADVYARRAGGTSAEWREVMRAETWYSAAEAVDAGLADAVDDDKPAVEAAFDLSIYAHAGRDQAPPPAFPGRTRAHMPPARPEEPTTHTEGVAMSDTLSKGLRERLGIKADAQLDEAGLLAALDETLAEQTEATSTSTPPGTVLIDQTVLVGLQADAAQGRQAREQQLTDQRESLVQAALADGRIAPTSAQDWRDSLAEAPVQAAKLLASLAKNAVPVQAFGYTGGVEESNDDDIAYEAMYGKEA